MTTACALPTMVSRGYQLDEGEDAIGLLESRCDARDDRDSLQHAMTEDGYLFLRGCLDREEVLAARRHILTQLAAEGQLDPAVPLMMGKPKPDAKLFFQPELAQKNNPPLQHLLYARQGNLMSFSRLSWAEKSCISISPGCAAFRPDSARPATATSSIWAAVPAAFTPPGSR
ncbi:MAG: hypothetical protein ACLQMO_00380 [Acidobacteriaceae bacterium]